jgi:hypothetical protein
MACHPIEFSKISVVAFAVERARFHGHMIAPRNFVERNTSIEMGFAAHLDAFVLDITKEFYKCRSSPRFTSESTQSTVEVTDKLMPATWWDALKDEFCRRFPNKWRWLHVEYVAVAITRTTIRKVYEVNEFACPHLDLPGDHRNHLLHLYLGPAWVQAGNDLGADPIASAFPRD